MLDRGELGRGTSHVSAGMLAPISEADAGEQALLRLGLESARAWPAFAAELEAASGVDVDYRAHGTLLVARDRDEAEALDRELALRARFGLRAERLLPSRARRARVRARPDRPPRARRARRPRRRPAPRRRARWPARPSAPGRVLRPRAEVAEVRPGEGVAHGAAASASPAGRVVLAAGAVVGRAARRPRRRRACRCGRSRASRCACATRPAPACIERVVRWDGGYLVPRSDGRYVLGATMEERGFDTAMTAGGVHDLLRDASELVPGVLELEVEELIAGLRPGTPDNAPIVGASPAAPELVWATGHYRNGALLTPVTADLVVAVLVRRGGRRRRSRPRASRGWRRDLRQRRAARARAARRSPSCSPTSASRRAPAASRSRSTARSSRAPSGTTRRVNEGERVEALSAMQGGAA